MRLPYQPETMDAAKARLPAALQPVIDPLECVATGVFPSRNRQHVFDFDDGLRLIVSRDKIGDEQRLHVSASFEAESPFGAFLRRDVQGFEDALQRMFKRIKELFGREVAYHPPDLITGRMVPHWYWPCQEVKVPTPPSSSSP